MALRTTEFDGSVVLVGDDIHRLACDTLRQSLTPRIPFQVILFTAKEAESLGSNIAGRLAQVKDIHTPIVLGSGKQDGTSFKTLFWSQGTLLRRQMKLPDRQFYIQVDCVEKKNNLEESLDRVSTNASLSGAEIRSIIRGCQKLTQSNRYRGSCDEITSLLAKHYITKLATDTFDDLWCLMRYCRDDQAAPELAWSYHVRFPEDVAGHMRMGDSLQLSRFAKRAMFHYSQAASHVLEKPEVDVRMSIKTADIPTVAVQKILDCWQYSEIGHIFQDRELSQLQQDPTFFNKDFLRGARLIDMIQKAYVEYMIAGLQDIEAFLPRLLSLASDQRLSVQWNGELFRLPRFFRWLVPFKLAVMSTPRSAEDVIVLRERFMIKTIFTLTAEVPLPATWFVDGESRNIFIPVKDGRAPSIEQVDYFIDTMSSIPLGEAALVHCGGGKGRAGTFAACYLMACAFGGHSRRKSELEDLNETLLYPAEAMRLIRRMRPGSIETAEQEKFVRKYGNLIQKSRASDSPSTARLDSDVPLEFIKGNIAPDTTLVVCCGIPGSGKSTFAASLATLLDFEVISQDELGSRNTCLSTLANHIQADNRVVIDSRNLTPEARQEWLAHAFLPKNALCVWFDVDEGICASRANARPNHKTIPQGRAKNVVASALKELKRPGKTENFRCIAHVKSIRAASELVHALGGAINNTQTGTWNREIAVQSVSPSARAAPQTEKIFIAFPRTRHLINLGAATKDDRIDNDSRAFLSISEKNVAITLEEKIDGANMGIQVDPESPTGFLVQSRNRFLGANPSDQFKKVNKWVSDHDEGLKKILLSNDQEEAPPGKFILYGEWMFMKHSIYYDKIIDLFLVFDIYDTEWNTFLSRSAIDKRLLGTSICQVPVVPSPQRLDERSLRDLVHKLPSAYSDGLAEGIYLRREKGDKVIDRAKIVRPDFKAGNDGWYKTRLGKMVMNEVVQA